MLEMRPLSLVVRVGLASMCRYVTGSVVFECSASHLSSMLVRS
jgi:hypothetical protein